MFNFNGNKGQNEESANREHQWNWASKESSATIVLVAILGVSLLGAQMLVRARTGYALDQQQAIANTADLISQVARDGLRYYLGNQTVTRYYLVEDDTGTIGYMVLSIEPEIQQGGTWILNGKKIYHTQGLDERRETFRVADDLSWYEQKTSVLYTTGDTRVEKLRYEEGSLQCTIEVSEAGRTSVLPPTKISTASTNNFILSGLLDFFSSVAIDNKYPEGVILALPFFIIYRENTIILHIENLWVQNGGKVPNEIRSSTPNGRCVTVDWLQLGSTQTVFYDKDHQLVWQKDMPEPASYIRQKTRSELLAAFPDAEQELNQMFRIIIDE